MVIRRIKSVGQAGTLESIGEVAAEATREVIAEASGRLVDDPAIEVFALSSTIYVNVATEVNSVS